MNIDLGFEVIKKQRVRLSQIEAPEMKTEAVKKSFKYLRDLAARLDFMADIWVIFLSRSKRWIQCQ
ncbi:MAG: hypothetical protein ACJA02_001214 [Myxococcota bacterium]